MAITNTAVTVASTVTSVAGVNQNRRKLLITNPNSTTVYIGGPGVTTSNGYPLLQNATLDITQQHREDASTHQQWYGIVASGTQAVRVTEVEN